MFHLVIKYCVSCLIYYLKNSLTLANSPTSRECVWNKYGAKKKGVEPKRISEMKWKKPHHSKKGKNIMKCFGSSLILSLQTSVKNKQTKNRLAGEIGA